MVYNINSQRKAKQERALLAAIDYLIWTADLDAVTTTNERLAGVIAKSFAILGVEYMN